MFFACLYRKMKENSYFCNRNRFRANERFLRYYNKKVIKMNYINSTFARCCYDNRCDWHCCRM